MLDKDQREKIQSTIRLLQLDQDEEIWDQAAAEFCNTFWRLPPQVYHDARELRERRRRLLDSQQALEHALQQCGEHKGELRKFRASLMVALENFLLSDGGGE
jgi:hypothetical protein